MYLEKYYNQKVLILMDEYDTAIHESYSNGFYTQVINFMRSFLNATFKGNGSLYKGVLTGILRVSKESMFSDFNNPDINDITNGGYATCFGFTETEVDNTFNWQNIEKNSRGGIMVIYLEKQQSITLGVALAILLKMKKQGVLSHIGQIHHLMH